MAEEVLEVARAIRPYLPALVGDGAAELDAAIADRLALARDDEQVADQLVDLLARSPETHAWAAQMLNDPELLPPEVSGLRDRGMLAGDAGPIDAVRYRCPQGDYVFYRLGLEDVPGPCPTHGSSLVPG
jgi:hypothetical protein